jgi:branched-chain amino acid transport system substrate-binding protein
MVRIQMGRRGKSVAIVSTIVGAALTLAACSSSGGTSSSGGGSGTVKIGAVFDLTGNLSQFGTASQTAVKMAISKLNGAGGFKVNGKTYKLSLEVIDGKSDVTATLAAARKLTSDHVSAIFGPDTDLTSIQTIGLLASSKTIEFMGGSADQPLLKTGHPLQFNILPLNAEYEANIIPLLKDEGVTSGKVMLVYPNDQIGQGVLPTYKPILEDHGYTIEPLLFPSDTTDFASVVTRIKSENPAAVIEGYATPFELPLTKAMVTQDLNVPLIGVSNAPSAVPLAIAQQTGKPFPMKWGSLLADENLIQPTSPGMTALRAEYTKFTGSAPDTASAQYTDWFYDAVGLLAQSMTQANSVTDVSAIAAKINAAHYVGAESWSFQDHHLVRGTDIATLIDGKTTWTYIPPNSVN